MKYKMIAVLIVIFSVVGILSVTAQTDMPTIRHTTAAVRSHPSQGDVRAIEGSAAELFATEAGLTMSFRTSELEPGHVYTAWWVVVNQPENCSATPCTSGDILGSVDSISTEVTYADGILASDQGKSEFAAFLPAGEVPEAWFGNGVTNPLGAEVHIVIHDHGTLIPDMADTMFNSLRGGCTDESVPAPYPDIAKADGEPGPNTCRLTQFAIFQTES